MPFRNALCDHDHRGPADCRSKRCHGPQCEPKELRIVRRPSIPIRRRDDSGRCRFRHWESRRVPFHKSHFNLPERGLEAFLQPRRLREVNPPPSHYEFTCWGCFACPLMGTVAIDPAVLLVPVSFADRCSQGVADLIRVDGDRYPESLTEPVVEDTGIRDDGGAGPAGFPLALSSLGGPGTAWSETWPVGTSGPDRLREATEGRGPGASPPNSPPTSTSTSGGRFGTRDRARTCATFRFSCATAGFVLLGCRTWHL